MEAELSAERDKTNYSGAHTHPIIISESELDQLITLFDGGSDTDCEQPDYARYFIGNGNSRNRVPMVDHRRF
jgi:hypothetical protein